MRCSTGTLASPLQSFFSALSAIMRLAAVVGFGLGVVDTTRAACFSLPHTRSRPSADRALSRFRTGTLPAAEGRAPSGMRVLHECSSRRRCLRQ